MTDRDAAPDDGRWDRVKELFHAALDRDRAERASFLDSACGADSGLRAEVESLVENHERETTFMKSPAAADMAQPEPGWEGRRLGPYRVVKELGRGGMGAVFLAVRDDDVFKKRVAVKVIKRGMDSDAIVKRFTRERQILANLDHPNIARLLDGGTTPHGLPYFVMEHIEGHALDDHCDLRRLSTGDRLALFRSICSAVQFAHQNLIVHRDIKPGNILVTADGVPKLLDFGIAKIVGGEAAFGVIDATATAERLLTPEYASPEQVRGEPVTTATDVYSLGVVLYELLTGHLPYRLKSRGFIEVARTICEVEPEKPSSAITRVEERAGRNGTVVRVTPESVGRARDATPQKLKRRLTGDLDTIVLKAMRKEPQRRYLSVEQLSEDVRRHLDGLPVLARDDTFAYRAAKFARRHRVGLAAAGVVLVSLVGGLGAAAWQAKVARDHKALAERAANSMVFELAAGLERTVGPTESRLGLLAQAAQLFDDLARLGEPTVELRRQQVEAGVVLSRTYRNLGDPVSSLRRADGAVEGARALVARSGEARDRGLLASSLLERGDALVAVRRQGDAQQAHEEGRALLEALDAAKAATADDRARLSVFLVRIGDRLYAEGRHAEAQALYTRAYDTSRSLLTDPAASVRFRSVHATSLERLADMLYEARQTPDACARYAEALAVRRRSREQAPDDPIVLRELAIALQNVGWCAEEEKAWSEALPHYEESIRIQRRLLDTDPHNTLVGPQLMGGLGTMGNALVARGDPPGAVAWYREAVAVGERFRADGRSTPAIDAKTADLAQLLAAALSSSGKPAEAAASLRSSERIVRELLASDPGNVEYRRLLEAVLQEKPRLRASAGSKAGAPGR
jgi:serine/threonine protein kinase/tetratricopeptide (TPR) repeat protein